MGKNASSNGRQQRALASDDDAAARHHAIGFEQDGGCREADDARKSPAGERDDALGRAGAQYECAGTDRRAGAISKQVEAEWRLGRARWDQRAPAEAPYPCRAAPLHPAGSQGGAQPESLAPIWDTVTQRPSVNLPARDWMLINDEGARAMLGSQCARGHAGRSATQYHDVVFRRQRSRSSTIPSAVGVRQA